MNEKCECYEKKWRPWDRGPGEAEEMVGKRAMKRS
jgi:hypothetical protein